MAIHHGFCPVITCPVSHRACCSLQTIESWARCSPVLLFTEPSHLRIFGHYALCPPYQTQASLVTNHCFAQRSAPIQESREVSCAFCLSFPASYLLALLFLHLTYCLLMEVSSRPLSAFHSDASLFFMCRVGLDLACRPDSSSLLTLRPQCLPNFICWLYFPIFSPCTY